MKINLLGLLICSLCYINSTYGQRRENVDYFKNSGAKVDNVDSADYVRVIREPETGSKLYEVAEYYKNEKVKFTGKSSKVEPLVYEGLCINYYPNGKKKEIINYNAGNRDGDSYQYFTNRKIYLHKRYVDRNMLIIDCADSTGNVTVTEGNGTYIGYNDDFKKVTEQGEIKDGLKNGKWSGIATFGQISLTYAEDYVDGKLIAGKSTDNNGESFTYLQRLVQPSFKGGLAGFGRYLSDGIRYPQLARTRREQGKVVVSFMVKPDGALDGFKVKENPNQSMTDEAIRILKISPKWEPGVFYGKVVSVWYTVPVVFKL